VAVFRVAVFRVAVFRVAVFRVAGFPVAAFRAFHPGDLDSLRRSPMRRLCWLSRSV
jgi:hypothetical protein